MPRCKLCKTKFEPKTFLQKHCLESVECIKAEYDYKLSKQKKKESKEWKTRKKQIKEGLKTKKDYEKEVEKVFNEYIRERDKSLPCISCNAKPSTYKITAGHYFPAGSYKNIRFDEDNVHGQCWYNCNSMKSGNLIEYRVGLIDRIGEQRLQELEKRAREVRKYTIPELILLKEEYKEKLRKLKL